MSRRGFTLIEMLFATSLFALIVGGVISAFLGIRRLTGTAFAEAELSVRMREVREKLLFHVAPPAAGTSWSGILSGSRTNGNDIVVNGKIKMDLAWGYSLSDDMPVEQDVEIARSKRSSATGEAGGCLVNVGGRIGGRASDGWLAPKGFTWFSADDDPFDVSRLIVDRDVFYINLESSVPDPAGNGRKVTRRERITVPVFGRVQRTMTATKVFND